VLFNFSVRAQQIVKMRCFHSVGALIFKFFAGAIRFDRKSSVCACVCVCVICPGHDVKLLGSHYPVRYDALDACMPFERCSAFVEGLSE